LSVSSTTTKNSYSGNGSTTAFAYAFKIFADADLEVIIRASAGTETIKTLTTHYTVSGAGSDSGGTVTFTTGNTPASGETVVIRRKLTLTQGTDYVENDPFPANSHEDGLDRLTFIAQGIQEELDRSFKVSKTNSITTPEFTDDASTRASKLLSFSSDGNSIEATTGRVNSVSVSNVAVSGGASQDATVSFNDTTGALALGIPVGSTGATGSTGSGGAAGSDGADGVGGLLYTFSTTTSDADPGAGVLRLNNGTLGSVSQIFIDDSTAASGNPDVSAFLLTWDDSTQTSDRGQVTITKKAAQQNFATYKISGASTDASGYVKLVVTHVVSNGSFSNSDAVLVSFVRTGNAGSLADPMTTRGDIIVRDSSNATARLAVGAASTVLVGGTDPSYAQVATSMIADDAVTAAKVASDAVVEASIADNAVTLAKMAGIARGKIIVGDASGNPAVIGPGTSGQALVSDGTDVAFGAVSGGKVVKYQNANVATRTSTTSTFPDDDTVPQSDEGAQYTTVAYTPVEAGNKIVVHIIAQAAVTGTQIDMALALFKNSDASAIRSCFFENNPGSNNGPHIMSMMVEDTAADTSEITYKLRFGMVGNTSGTAYLGSGHHSIERFGDNAGVQIHITEFDA